jgi:hypothetical protein
LAEGPSVTAERIAGPFEVPFSVALLPDGSFLVTERPDASSMSSPAQIPTR